MIVTVGQRGDAPQVGALFEGLKLRHVIVDAAYESEDAAYARAREKGLMVSSVELF